MSSDYGDFCRDIRDARREARAKYGVDCPGCRRVQPKRIPSVLLPGQRCRVCGYVDPRERTAANSYLVPARSPTKDEEGTSPAEFEPLPPRPMPRTLGEALDELGSDLT